MRSSQKDLDYYNISAHAFYSMYSRFFSPICNNVLQQWLVIFRGTSLHVHLRDNKKEQSNSQITNNLPCSADLSNYLSPLDTTVSDSITIKCLHYGLKITVPQSVLVCVSSEICCIYADELRWVINAQCN